MKWKVLIPSVHHRFTVLPQAVRYLSKSKASEDAVIRIAASLATSAHGRLERTTALTFARPRLVDNRDGRLSSYIAGFMFWLCRKRLSGS